MNINGIPWSVTIPIALIFIAFIVRGPIGQAIGRIRSIGKTGVVLDTEQKGSARDLDPKVTAEKLLENLNTTLLNEQAEAIRAELRQKGLLGTPEGEKVLVQHLASAQLGIAFADVYRLIFGSQVAALRYLNLTQNRSGVPAESLRVFYTAAAAQYEGFYKTYSYESWWKFMKDRTLIRDDDGFLSITVLGLSFSRI